MSEPMALLAACAHEVALVRAHVTVRHQTMSQVGRLWYGTLHRREVVLVQCGMGPHRLTQAVAWLAEHYSLSGLLNIGFAGGLQADLATGDGVLITAVRGLCNTSSAVPSSEALQPDARLGHIAAMALAQAAVIGHTGTLLSVPDLLWQATAKQHLGQQTGAQAVDMESYSLAQMAQQLHLPFAIVRTIFDPATEDFTFPVAQCMTIEGDLHAGRLGYYLVRHPHLVRHLPHWWRQSRRAGRQLQRWVKHFFILLGQGA